MEHRNAWAYGGWFEHWNEEQKKYFENFAQNSRENVLHPKYTTTLWIKSMKWIPLHRRQLTPIESDTIRFCTVKVFSTHKFISQIDVSPNEYNMICCCCCENVDSCRVDIWVCRCFHIVFCNNSHPFYVSLVWMCVCMCAINARVLFVYMRRPYDQIIIFVEKKENICHFEST